MVVCPLYKLNGKGFLYRGTSAYYLNSINVVQFLRTCYMYYTRFYIYKNKLNWYAIKNINVLALADKIIQEQAKHFSSNYMYIVYLNCKSFRF